MLPYRLNEFLLGSLLYFVRKFKVSNFICDTFFFLVLAFLFYFVFTYDQSNFPGIKAFFVCLLIFIVLYFNNFKYAFFLIKNKFIQHIGKISYSLFLLHWPIIVFVNYLIIRQLSLFEKLFLFLVILILSNLLFNLIENFFAKINLQPELDFFNNNSRKLFFATNLKNLQIIKVRSFDVATFVKFGGADLGICGFDVLAEFPSKQIFSVLDLKIGKCRLSIAGKQNSQLNFANTTSLRIATKYSNITAQYFSQKGIQAEIIKLSGAVEIASWLNLADFIVDLVSTGKTLLENNMQEISTILQVSSCLIVNRTSFKVNNLILNNIITIFNEGL